MQGPLGTLAKVHYYISGQRWPPGQANSTLSLPHLLWSSPPPSCRRDGLGGTQRGRGRGHGGVAPGEGLEVAVAASEVNTVNHVKQLRRNNTKLPHFSEKEKRD